MLPAFLIEIGLYIIPGFEPVRHAFDRSGSRLFRSAILTASAWIPYLLESLSTGTFRITSFIVLVILSAAAAFWYALLQPSPQVDVLFMVFMAAVFLTGILTGIYVRPVPHLQIDILGRLMWIRLGIMSVLSLRKLQNIRFGFFPSLGEWRIGLQQFLFFLPVGALAVYLSHFARFHPQALIWWKFALFVPATFFGILWVVALGEEFFFRGFLQQLVTRSLRSKPAGLFISAVCFGSAHLSYRGFPNWRFALIAALAGVFYGLAFIKARSIRASMVTHALVVTTWRSLFA